VLWQIRISKLAKVTEPKLVKHYDLICRFDSSKSSRNIKQLNT